MDCPQCNSETDVKDSRVRKTLGEVWRKRRCRACLFTFGTYEHYTGPETDVPAVVQDLRRELAIFIERLGDIAKRAGVEHGG